MIGPAIIRFIYAFGALLGTVGIVTTLLLNSAILSYISPSLSVILAIPVTIFAVVIFNAVWRLSWELVMLRYDTNMRLAKLTEKGRNG